MSKISRDGSKEKISFFSGKGFYIALVISLVAVGGAAWIGVNSAMDKLDENNTMQLDQSTPQIEEEDNDWVAPDKSVDKAESDVPADNKVDNVKPDVATPDTPPAAPVIVEGYIMPLKGDVINTYSGDKVVKSKTLDEWVMHTGIDIAAEVSTPVKAASGGKVVEIRNDDMWGACVVIEHQGGMQSHYYNLKSSINVKKNQTVKLGDVIGAVGASAEIEQAEASHLHFGMKKGDAWVNPADYIK